MMRRIAALWLFCLLAASSALAANRYFQATTDNQWDNDDGGGGANSNWSSTTPGFTAAAKPVTGDVVTISQNCTCDSDESGAVLTGLTITAAKTLTVAATGVLYCANANYTCPAGGLVMVAGSIIRLIETDNVTHYVLVTGALGITGSGTIQLSATNANRANVYLSAATSSIIGASLAAPIVVRGNLGGVAASSGVVLGSSATVQYVEASHCTRGITPAYGTTVGITIDSVLVHDCTTAGVDFWVPAACSGVVSNSYIYSNGSGLLSTNVSPNRVTVSNCVFGQDKDATPAANTTQDVATDSALIFRKCLFTHATEVTQASPYPTVLSTRHDQDANAFKTWFGKLHTAETETTTVRTAGSAIKIVTSSSGAATLLGRARYHLASYPATHGNTLDVTVYVRGTAGAKISCIVDPDSIFGTTQTSGDVTCTDAGTWYLATVAQYTVATVAGKQSAIPIVIQSTEASKTYYVDDMAISLNGGAAEAITFDFAPYDGVFSREAAAGGGGGAQIIDGTIIK